RARSRPGPNLPRTHRACPSRSLLRRTDACRRVLPRTGLKYGLEPPQADPNVPIDDEVLARIAARCLLCEPERPTSRKASLDGLDGIERAWEDAHRRRSRGDA